MYAPPGEFFGFLQKLESHWRESAAVVIHCLMGVGRSALTAACLLAMRGIPVAAAFEVIAKARECPVPDTSEQRSWVESFAKDFIRPRTG